MGKKKKEPDVRQPEVESQQEYLSLRDNDCVEVLVRRKKYKVYPLRNGQIAKLSRLLLRKKSVEQPDGGEKKKVADYLSDVLFDQKLACKAAAIFLQHGHLGWLKLKLRYWWLWRWFYYVREYTSKELAQLLTEGKKKVPLDEFLTTTILLTGVKDTLMMMRREEAERILQELSSAQSTPSVSPAADSTNRGTSSAV